MQVNQFLPKLKAKVRVGKIWFFFIFFWNHDFSNSGGQIFFNYTQNPLIFQLWPKNYVFLQNEKKINHLLFYSPWTQGNLLIASQVCRWSHKRLPPAFYLYLSFICDVITMAVREQLGMWAGGRIYLYFSQAQDLDFVPDSLEQNWICGNFPTIVKVITSHYNGGKIPTDTVLLQWIWDKIQILCLRKV